MKQRYKKKLKVYIAAPLFSEMERKFNLEVRDFLYKLGFDTYLPQLNGGLCLDLVKSKKPPRSRESKESRRIIFAKDLEEIRNCDLFLIILDGRVPDEGACVELGIAYTLGKTSIGFKTDARVLVDGRDNLMIAEILDGKIAKNFSELELILAEIKKKLRR